MASDRMKLVTWIFRIVLFVLLFVLALRNTGDASLQLFFGAVWHAPLILILLAAFAWASLRCLAAVAPDRCGSAWRQGACAVRLAKRVPRRRPRQCRPRLPGVPYNVVGPKV
jgi:uncharacterized integral membrane protein